MKNPLRLCGSASLRFIFLDRLHLEDVVSPGGQLQKQPVRREIAAVSVVGRFAQPVVQPPGPSGQVVPRHTQVALAGVRDVVHHHQAALVPRPGPGEGDESLVAPVAFPGRAGFEQMPVSVTESGVLQAGQQTCVERSDRTRLELRSGRARGGSECGLACPGAVPGGRSAVRASGRL